MTTFQTPRLESFGLTHYNNWMRLLFDLADLAPATSASPLTVRAIGPEDAAAFATIVGNGFGFPAPLAPLCGAPA